MRAHLHHFAQISLLAAGLAGASLPCAAQTADFGKPGDPIKLTVGYQPYYTETWSGAVLKAKDFCKQHLRAGSEVKFEPGLVGSVIVGQMIAGQEQIGYVGDMPGIIAS